MDGKLRPRELNVTLHQIFEIHVRREMSLSITRATPRNMTIAVVSEVLEVRSVDQRNAGIRASQSLAALLCGFLEPPLLDERFEALEDGV
jgi:hypothetical protein